MHFFVGEGECLFIFFTFVHILLKAFVKDYLVTSLRLVTSKNFIQNIYENTFKANKNS
jgi:hypothetical protein